MVETINLETWERASHYNFFKRMDYPHHSICVQLDITQFMKTIKERELPFYLSMIFITSSAINTVKEFRYRVREDKVVLHNKVHPSFTDMEDEHQLFKMVTVPLSSTPEAFVSSARELSKNQNDSFSATAGRDDLIYFSCNPWVTFTSITHTVSLDPSDSIPRVAWGKFFEQNGKILLPFSVQAHHSFVDGIHMGQYINAVQEALNNTDF